MILFNSLPIKVITFRGSSAISRNL